MNRTQRLSAVAAGLLGAASIAAGCGSDTEQANDYVDQVNTLQVELVDQVNDAVSGTPPADPEAAAEVATDLQGVFETSADDLAAIEPPTDVADLHQQLVGSVSDVGDQIAEAEQAFSSGDPQQAAQAALQLQSATTELQTELNGLIDEINAQLQG